MADAQSPADVSDDAPKAETRDIVTEAKDNFEKWTSAYSSNRLLAIEDTKFVLGDSDNGYQWPTDIFRLRSVIEKRPCLTVNVTAQHCNQVINNIRQNRPQCKILPGDAKASKKAAEIYAGLIRGIQAANNADVAHDTAAEHAIYGGEGFWVISTDYESPDSFNQCITITPVENPQLVLIDPYCGMNKLKARGGFIFEDISKEEAKRKYGNDGVDPSSWTNDATRGWVQENTCRIAKYYYCDEVEDTLYMLGDGSTILESDLREQAGPDLADEAVKHAQASAQMIEAQTKGRATRKTTRLAWKVCTLVGGHDKPVDEKDWPGAYLPIIQVVGKEVNVNGEIIRKGVVRDLKDPARMVNYSYSAAIETVALQNKIPYIAPQEAIEGFEDQWKVANQSNASYLPYNAFNDEGEPIPRPERQEPAVMPSAQVNMLQLSVEQMRAASGQQNANFGIRSEAQSGVGIQRLKVQGEVATFHFPDNLARGLHDEATVLLDLIPRVYDTRRVMQTLGIDGKDGKVVVDPDMAGPYADISEEDVKAALNPTVGKYVVVIDTGPSYQTMRQEGADRMMELAGRDPQLMQVAGDIIMQSMDFPFADQLAKRLQKTLPPNLQDTNDQTVPPQVQAQMHDMAGHIQQLTQALHQGADKIQQLQSTKMTEFYELLVDAYGKETDRLKVIGTAMNPQQVQQIVMKTLQQVMSSPDPMQGAGPPGGMPTIPAEQAPLGAFSLPTGQPAQQPGPSALGNPGIAGSLGPSGP